MTDFCDLHTHSHYSDGTFSPEQLLQAACQAQLQAIALCDHNTVAGLPDFLRAAENYPVEAIAGVEFSTEYAGTELHMLALYVQPRYYAVITDMMRTLLQRKEQSNRDLVAALNAAGFALDYDRICAEANGYVNRAHIGAEMTRKGYTASVQAAFKEYLNPKRGYYTPPERLDALEAIRFIKSIGAVAVLAHPFLNLDEAGLRQFLPKAVACGLDAMEVRYPAYSPEQTRLAGAIAAEFGLLPSGGSDFHGENKPHIRLGVGQGDLQIPAIWAKQLKQRQISPEKC